MKPSRYNFVYPYQFNKDYSVVYNALNDTAGIVTSREAEFIKSCDRSLGIHNTKVEAFQKKGFIIDANMSELSALKVAYLKSKFDTKLLSIVIVPTYQCNLDCACCYEKLSYSTTDNTIMTEQVQDSILQWISSNLQGIERMEISWHGGEPLVALEAVKRLGTMLKKLADEHGIQYKGMMSTNGYLLTGPTAKALWEIGIKQYKMSVDGCRENHDSRKRHKDGSPTYDVILGNLETNIEYIDEVDLRINIMNKDDLKDAYEIVTILREKGLLKKVIPRLGKPAVFLDEANDLDCNREEKDQMFTREEFSCEAIKYSLSLGIGPSAFSKIDCFCQINHINGIIVDGHGTLFKCVSDTGDGQSCGKLTENGSLVYNKNYYAYGLSNPMELALCEGCPFLPVCIGECAYDRKEGRPCIFGSLSEACKAQYINAYVVKRLLNRLQTVGFSTANAGGRIDEFIMGDYDEAAAKFLRNAASTYMLGDLIALAEKSKMDYSNDELQLLLQLIQPTELAD